MLQKDSGPEPEVPRKDQNHEIHKENEALVLHKEVWVHKIACAK